MLDTMVAGTNPDLYYDLYYQLPDLASLSPEYRPVTVPMVSTNSSPPMAMPVQVPHGHVVQQIVDENGTLRHVILSPQHPPIVPMPPHHFGGTNASSQAQGYYPGAMSHAYAPFSPLQPGVLGHAPHPQGHSPPPHSFHKDERSLRQYNKLKRKLEQKQLRENPTATTPPLSPRKELNGNSRKVGSVATSEDGEESSSVHDEEEDLTSVLSTIKAPQVSDVTSRTALVQWAQPPLEGSLGSEVQYEVLLSDKGKEGKYKSIYRGEALSCRIEDLRPGTEYCVCVSARLGQCTSGCPSEPTTITTPPCRPDPPTPPKLASRSKNMLTLKWIAAQDNGAHIDCYVLECDMNGTWSEVARTKNKQAHIPKLQPATPFSFRLAAINQFGKSDYSEVVKFETCDSPPTQPAPPVLSYASPNSLTLHWQGRPQDDDFTLQMEEPDSKHGFLPVYSGKDLSYLCTGLDKFTTYKFRLKCENEEGSSPWSEEVSFRTLPGRPGVPCKVQLKGRTHSHSFRLKWDPPIDKGGSTIRTYTVQVAESKSGEYTTHYTGPITSCTIDRLSPGTSYNVRVSCEGPGGTSEYSEVQNCTTEPVCPAQCHPPRLHAKPRARAIPLKWSYPDNDGGSEVTKLELLMRTGTLEDEGRIAYQGSETEFTVTDIQPASLYYFAVRATNKVGAGAWSETVEVQSSSAAPERPSGPELSCSGASVQCSWSAPQSNGQPVSQYHLQMATPPLDTFTTLYQGPATHYEVKPVPPATLCVFKLQACNSVGCSEWSELSTVFTEAGAPGACPGLKCSPAPTSLALEWNPPTDNGDPVTHYTLEVGDVSTTAEEPRATVEDLSPATTYRVRVRGVNRVGPGAVSSIKVSTLALPPEPPLLSCASPAHNYLKLRWTHPSAAHSSLSYTLTLYQPNSRKGSVIYTGSSTSYKACRLQEQTEYSFTISATNATGKGPESPMYSFTTTIAPPPPVKGVKVVEVKQRSCQVEWSPLRCQDPVEYTVQCARLRQQVFKTVYHGSDTRCEVSDLESGADYLVRVCGSRQVVGGKTVEGAFCTPLPFSTPSPLPDLPPHQQLRQHSLQSGGRRPLTDQQWAAIILCCFCVLAVLFAVIIANLIY